MSKHQDEYANRGPIEYTSISSAVTFSPPIPWIQVVTAGSGGLVVKAENGTARTYTGLVAERVLHGPFSEITSMTCTKIMVGDGRPPSVVPAGDTAVGVTIADAGTFTAQTTVEGAIQEMYQHLFSTVGGYIPISLGSLREVDATGDVGDASANGGVLASDTTPTYTAVATSNEHAITWATGNVDPIGVSITLPRDFDDTANATIDLVVASGTTNAATIVCASAWSAGAAGTEVSDSTSDTATKSATPHTLSVDIAASDIPAGARRVTIRLTPPTHATDTIVLYGVGIAYKRKLLTS